MLNCSTDQMINDQSLLSLFSVNGQFFGIKKEDNEDKLIFYLIYMEKSSTKQSSSDTMSFTHIFTLNNY